MSRKQIDQQLMREGVLYGGLSVLITLTAGTAVTYICFQSMNYMKIPFTVPAVPVILAVILVIMICIITPVCSYRKLIGGENSSGKTQRLRVNKKVNRLLIDSS